MAVVTTFKGTVWFSQVLRIHQVSIALLREELDLCYIDWEATSLSLVAEARLLEKVIADHRMLTSGRFAVHPGP